MTFGGGAGVQVGNINVSFTGNITQFAQTAQTFVGLLNVIAQASQATATNTTQANQIMMAGFTQLNNTMMKVVKQHGQVAQATAVTNQTTQNTASSIGRSVISWNVLVRAIESTIRQLTDFVKSSMEAGAKLEIMANTAIILGERVGVSEQDVRAMSAAIQEMGTSATSANLVLAQLTRFDVDLAYATKLARTALDLSVLSGGDLEETFDRLMHAIASLQTRTLHYIGINVHMAEVEKRTADALDKTVSQLTEEEIRIGLINEILKEGERLNGLWEQSINLAAIKMRLLGVESQRLSERLGIGLLPVFNSIVDIARAFVAGLTKAVTGSGPFSQWIAKTSLSLVVFLNNLDVTSAVESFMNGLGEALLVVNELWGALAEVRDIIVSIGKFGAILLPPILAALGGALLGSSIGPFGTISGGLLGATIGFAQGDKFMQTIERYKALQKEQDAALVRGRHLVGQEMGIFEGTEQDIASQINESAWVLIKKLEADKIAYEEVLKQYTDVRYGVSEIGTWKPSVYGATTDEAGYLGYEEGTAASRVFSQIERSGVLANITTGFNAAREAMKDVERQAQKTGDAIIVLGDIFSGISETGALLPDTLVFPSTDFLSDDFISGLLDQITELGDSYEEAITKINDKIADTQRKYNDESILAEKDYWATRNDALVHGDNDEVAKLDREYAREKALRDRENSMALVDLRAQKKQEMAIEEAAINDKFFLWVWEWMIKDGILSGGELAFIAELKLALGAETAEYAKALDDKVKLFEAMAKLREDDATGAKAASDLIITILADEKRRREAILAGEPDPGSTTTGGLPGVSSYDPKKEKDTERATTTLANVMQEISSAITDAMNAFYEVLGYRSPAFEAGFALLMEDIRWAVRVMYQNFELLGKDIVERAGLFATNAATVVGAIASAIDAFEKLEKYRAKTSKILANLAILKEQIIQAINTIM
jgi:hypothetical protein